MSHEERLRLINAPLPTFNVVNKSYFGAGNKIEMLDRDRMVMLDNIKLIW